MPEKSNARRRYILLAIVAMSLATTAVDAFLKPDYLPKILVKILCFLVIPALYFLIWRDEAPAFRSLFRFRGRTMVKAALFGTAIYATIVGGYFATRSFIDFSNVTNTLTQTHGITADNFLYVSLYLSIANSFLEEFFFRGFGFITLRPHTARPFAYLFSPILFAVYHAGMLIGMLPWYGLAAIFTGLVAGGIIFNYLGESSGNLYTSWIAHMCANFAINTVGFILFAA